MSLATIRRCRYAAWRIPGGSERMHLPSLFAKADYVTLHVPLLSATEGLINEESLRSFKPGSVVEFR